MLKPGIGEDQKGDSLTKQLGLGRSEQEKTNTTLMQIHQTMELTRLRQDDIYQVMLIQDPSLGEKIAAMAENMGVGIDNMSKEEGEHSFGGVRTLGTAAQKTKENKEWSDVGVGISETSAVAKMLSRFGNSLSGAIKGVSGEKIPEASADYLQPVHRAPPGNEAGISHVMHGHKPNLGIPELPRLNLPSAKEGGDSAGLIPPLSITHTLAPIQIDFTGIGDQAIRRVVDAEILKSETDRIRHGGGGT